MSSTTTTTKPDTHQSSIFKPEHGKLGTSGSSSSSSSSTSSTSSNNNNNNHHHHNHSSNSNNNHINNNNNNNHISNNHHINNNNNNNNNNNEEIISNGDNLTDQDYFAEELLALEEAIDRAWQDFESQRTSINENYRQLDKITKTTYSFQKQYQNLLFFYERHMKSQLQQQRQQQQQRHTNILHSDSSPSTTVSDVGDGSSNNHQQDDSDIAEVQELQIQEEAWEERLLKIKEEIESLLQTRKKVGSLFLRLVIGRINMRVWSEKERILLKQEYVKFKSRTNVIFVLFPIIQLLWRYYSRGDGIFSSHYDPNSSYTVEWVLCQWHHGWLLYLYLSLAIREYILRLNGSRIYIWWIYHHHISSLMSFVSILLMRSAYTRFKLIFDYATCLFLIIGFIQVWQNDNSKRRHYARIAMGRAGTLDVSASETVVELPSSGFEFQCLKLCLYLLYGLEISIGIATMVYVFIQGYELPPENRFDLFQFEGYLLGFLTMFIGLGNAFALYTRPDKPNLNRAHHSSGTLPTPVEPNTDKDADKQFRHKFTSTKISKRLMKGAKLHRSSQEKNLASIQEEKAPTQKS